MKRYGLIGHPLGHSFSKKYFGNKFQELELEETHSYELFDIENLTDFPALLEQYPDLLGLNVTVPHKENIKKYLDRLDESAEKVGAVNVIKIELGQLIGFNSDYFAFKQSLINLFQGDASPKRALILGGGGASKAVEAALLDLKFDYQVVSRDRKKGNLIYDDLHKNPNDVVKSQIIINTTPLGMHPNLDTKPHIPYEAVHAEQYLYDIVYNPEETAFMLEGRHRGARTKNGLEMLHLQADRSWEIWNS